MTTWHFRTVLSLLLLSLLQLKSQAVLGGWLGIYKHPGDLSSGIRAFAAGKTEVGSAAIQRDKRGASFINTSTPKLQNTVASSENICPYKVIPEGHTNSRNICFRTTDSDFRCDQNNCKVYSSGMSLLANVLKNSSVLLQWRPPDPQGHSLKGFYMNCSWNGTFTRFQCDSVQLGTNCRDYLLTNVHDNVKYRVCLQTLYTNRTPGEECVEFSVEPAGMQDIVIAMTAVGGSICVMLVIICLLVAYITENLMHPAFTHPSAKRGP